MLSLLKIVRDHIVFVITFIIRCVFHLVYLLTNRHPPASHKPPSAANKPNIKSIAVIGAGPSGLASLKIFKEFNNFERVVCFEAENDVGGIWNWDNDNTAMYDTLQTNTSKHLMHYCDFQMPNSYPDFPHYSQVFQYLQDYAAKFDLKRWIKFGCSVKQIDELKGDLWPRWKVTYIERGKTFSEEFDAVCVCNGHYAIPKIPPHLIELESTYTKAQQIVHSKDFRKLDLSKLRDKTCLVVGIGSSGAEVAARLGAASAKTYVSCTEHAIVLPKYVTGKPIDQVTNVRVFNKFPILALLNFLLRIWNNLPKSYHFRHVNRTPPPKVKGNVTPGLSTELIQCIGYGSVHVRHPIASFDEQKIVFTDGKECSPDVIVFATGYHMDYPFLGEDAIQREGYRIGPLYKHVFHTRKPTLTFVGIPYRVHPFPLAELQSRWIERVWAGEISLPSAEQMEEHTKRRELDFERKGVQKRFWNRVEYVGYAGDIAKEADFYAHSLKWDNSMHFIPLMFYPMSPFSFRLHGKGAIPEAHEKIWTVWNS